MTHTGVSVVQPTITDINWVDSIIETPSESTEPERSELHEGGFITGLISLILVFLIITDQESKQLEDDMHEHFSLSDRF